MDTTTIIGATTGLVTIVGLASSGWIAAWWQRGKTSDQKDHARDLRWQLNSKESELEASAAEVEALKIVNQGDKHDPLASSWFEYTVKQLAAFDLPAAELIAGAFERGMHPDDLSNEGGQGADREARPTGTRVPLIDHLAVLQPATDSGEPGAVG